MSVLDQETEFKMVAHIISESPHGVRARLVLKDDEGFIRVVLAVGETQGDYASAVDDVVSKYEAKLRSLEELTN